MMTTRSRFLRVSTVVGALALTLPAVASCSSSPQAGTHASNGETISVVASTTQICDYVTQIASGGEELAFTRTGADGATEELGADPSSASTHLTLTCLLAPNASAHEHEMTAAQSKALSEADMFLVSGVDLEHFLDDAVKATGFHGTMVVTSGVLTADELDDMDARKAKEKDLPYTVDRGEQAGRLLSCLPGRSRPRRASRSRSSATTPTCGPRRPTRSSRSATSVPHWRRRHRPALRRCATT